MSNESTQQTAVNLCQRLKSDKISRSTGVMKAYSIEFRQNIVKAYLQRNTSMRKVAARFEVNKSFVQKLLKQQKTHGHLNPGKPGRVMKSELDKQSTKLTLMVEKYPDATLSE